MTRVQRIIRRVLLLRTTWRTKLIRAVPSLVWRPPLKVSAIRGRQTIHRRNHSIYVVRNRCEWQTDSRIKRSNLFPTISKLTSYQLRERRKWRTESEDKISTRKFHVHTINSHTFLFLPFQVQFREEIISAAARIEADADSQRPCQRTSIRQAFNRIVQKRCSDRRSAPFWWTIFLQGSRNVSLLWVIIKST